jgi:dihydrofolate reductase
MLDFTRLTANRILVMGYNTFKSLPSNFRIGNRKILVVTNNLGGYGLPHWTSWKPVYQKIQPLTLPKTAYTNDISLVGIDSLKLNYVICGGLQLFNHHLGKLPLRLTKILKGEFKADTYFPEFKHLNHQSCSKFHYDSNIDFYKISWVNFL